MIYNMTCLETNWETISCSLNHPEEMSAEMRQDFNDEFIKKLKPVMKKLIDAVDLIKKELPRDSYALCNTRETVAQATEKELDGKPLSKEFRKFLYKLGKPRCKTMSYLDEREKTA